jgi:hypothetical protein
MRLHGPLRAKHRAAERHERKTAKRKTAQRKTAERKTAVPSGCYQAVIRLFSGCYQVVMVVIMFLSDCYKVVSRFLSGCYRVITGLLSCCYQSRVVIKLLCVRYQADISSCYGCYYVTRLLLLLCCHQVVNMLPLSTIAVAAPHTLCGYALDAYT